MYESSSGNITIAALGGTIFWGLPSVLEELKWAGINLVSTG